MVIMTIMFIVLVWGLVGNLLHHFLYARKEKDYDSFGYVLSAVLGPFTYLALRDTIK